MSFLYLDDPPWDLARPATQVVSHRDCIEMGIGGKAWWSNKLWTKDWPWKVDIRIDILDLLFMEQIQDLFGSESGWIRASAGDVISDHVGSCQLHRYQAFPCESNDPRITRSSDSPWLLRKSHQADQISPNYLGGEKTKNEIWASSHLPIHQVIFAVNNGFQHWC